MSPTPRTAGLVAAAATTVLILPIGITMLVVLAVLAGAAVDARIARHTPTTARSLPRILSRGIPSPFTVKAASGNTSSVAIRQAVPADVSIDPGEGRDRLQGQIVARRRGRHLVPAAAVRVEGPLGLGSWQHDLGGEHELLVYPDLVSARKLALAVRQGRFRDPGIGMKGPLGLGTEFDSIRDYLPDDDVRQINWQASARLDRPMSNQYRLEQDQDVICVLDAGRLMAAPLGDRTRLDIAVDAMAAVCLVADEIGDRCGAIAFDSSIIRRVSTRRRGSDAVVRTIFDVETSSEDSDYELAFRVLGAHKRALVIVLTDLLEETAARPLIEAVPVLGRRHHVVIASATDTDLRESVRTRPREVHDVYTAAVAVEVNRAREHAAARLTEAGAKVVEAVPEKLAAACVREYLRTKAAARL